VVVSESVMSISEDMTEQLRVELELRKLTTRLMNLQDEERRRICSRIARRRDAKHHGNRTESASHGTGKHQSKCSAQN
jgi:hypothetical protein